MLDALCFAASQYPALEEYRTAKVIDLVKAINLAKCFGEINCWKFGFKIQILHTIYG